MAAENVSSFILSALGEPEHSAGIFIVADDEQVSTPDFVRRMAAAVGRRVHLLPLPVRLIRLALRSAGQARLGDSILGSLEVDTSKARATGWWPVLSLDEGLRLALAD